jgi:hypothetical protein
MRATRPAIRNVEMIKGGPDPLLVTPKLYTLPSGREIGTRVRDLRRRELVIRSRERAFRSARTPISELQNC